MNEADYWLLPEGVDEWLPPQAMQLERLCRQAVDTYRSWGYQLVIPPLIEYVESLATGTGGDLDLQTFKLTDQLSGRLMGIRADTTSQAARIDANKLRCDGPARLCYLGTVLHARGPQGENRCPLQTGAELFGHAGIESDAEVLGLMRETLCNAGLASLHIGLGHVGIFQSLVRQAQLNGRQELELYAIVQRKAGDELQSLLRSWSRAADTFLRLLPGLVELHGDAAVLDDAERLLRPAGQEVLDCIRDLRRLLELAAPDLRAADTVHFDLADLRGYSYHTGPVFAAYLPGLGRALTSGGRYDHIGEAFGRARPATGFSIDLKQLARQVEQPPDGAGAILSPWPVAAELRREIRRLRAAGEVVIRRLPGQRDDFPQPGCDRELRLEDGKWRVVSRHGPGSAGSASAHRPPPPGKGGVA